MEPTQLDRTHHFILQTFVEQGPGFGSLALCWLFRGQSITIDSPCLDCGEPLRVVARTLLKDEILAGRHRGEQLEELLDRRHASALLVPAVLEREPRRRATSERDRPCFSRCRRSTGGSRIESQKRQSGSGS